MTAEFETRLCHLIQEPERVIPSANSFLLQEQIREVASQLLGKDEPYLISGPRIWHQKIIIGQTTASFSFRLIYNNKLDANVIAGSTSMLFVKTPFPQQEWLEWWIVDILNGHFLVEQTLDYLVSVLRGRIKHEEVIKNSVDVQKLLAVAAVYGTAETRQALSCIS